MELQPYLIKCRRALHQIPELALEEKKTSEFIVGELKALRVKHYTVGTAVIAEIRGREKTTVALRADIDALPITEANELPYRSTHAGRMHACGHDGHMAMLLAVAALASETAPKYTLRLIFQPAEENGGGAERLIEAGVLKGVDRIYGLHMSPDYPKGTIATDGGAILAGVCDYTVEFYGKGVHCAVRDAGIDAIIAAYTFCERAERLYRASYARNSLHHVGRFTGGVASNIVADRAAVSCTFRFFDPADKESFFMRIQDILNGIYAETGAGHRLTVTGYYPPLVNDAALADELKTLCGAAECGSAYTSEDFAFYLEKVPGVFSWVGFRDETHSSALHSADFDFDEGALAAGVELYKKLIY
ncbi:MAG: amidohydrolase [Clostridiales bacterium]|jgi:amidohydrolase|nr:amidohydrolase [Clostridiales bacterium]